MILMYPDKFRSRKAKPVSRPQVASLDDDKADAPSFIDDITTLQQFHLFSKLPKELRLKVWEMVTEEQRVVSIAINKLGLPRLASSKSPASKLGPEVEKHRWSELTSSTAPPSLLSVCVESREVGLEKYTLAFGCRAGGWWSSQRHPGRIFFNFNHDILYLQRNGRRTDYSWDYKGKAPVIGTRLYGPLDPNDKKRVQFLCFDLGLKANITSLNWLNIQQWPALKCLYLGLQEPRLDLDRAVGFIPLKEKRHKAFVEACRSLFPFRILNAGALPRPASRVEWIKTHCIHGYCGPEDQLRREEVKRTEVCLVSVVNS